jgi:hypothetical protein
MARTMACAERCRTEGIATTLALPQALRRAGQTMAAETSRQYDIPTAPQPNKQIADRLFRRLSGIGQ